MQLDPSLAVAASQRSHCPKGLERCTSPVDSILLHQVHAVILEGTQECLPHKRRVVGEHRAPANQPAGHPGPRPLQRPVRTRVHNGFWQAGARQQSPSRTSAVFFYNTGCHARLTQNAMQEMDGTCKTAVQT